MTSGIVSYGAYLPYWRLDRAALGAFLGAPGGRGTRSVASYDEDSTSMGVEAARLALAAADGTIPSALYFATTSPPYLDKNNASALHAALDLPDSAFAVDMLGSVRSAVGVLRAAADASRPTLAVLSDIRTGLPGGADERDGGDGAAAFLFGSGDGVLAEPVATASVTGEFLDRWRLPGDDHSQVWEERFGEHMYAPLAEQAFASALKAADVTVSEVDRLVVTGQSARAARTVARQSGVAPEALADDLSSVVGNTGAAHPGLLLAALLDQASAGQLLAVMVLADGVDVLLLRTTAAAARFRPAVTVAQQVAARVDVDYGRYLTWRGMLRREPPRRPAPDRPGAPPSARHESWKYAFVGSRCLECGERHQPPQRVCHRCHAVDRMQRERLADTSATLATYSVDWLAYSPSPPVVLGVVDFEGGGRLQCELTDVDPASIAIGDRLQMTFRRLFTAHGVHNYFWKARPVRKVD
jgi:hydroxymethylglutaryl-CoA synthase